jgi:hypothetical protein
LFARRKYLNESEHEGVNGDYVEENRKEIEHKTRVGQRDIHERPRKTDKQEVKVEPFRLSKMPYRN